MKGFQEPKFPDYKLNYIKTVEEPCLSRGGSLQQSICVLPPPPPPVVTHTAPAPIVAYTAPTPVVVSLTGSIGYALPYGNCVLEVPASIRPDGNPSTWPVLTQAPYIGAVALFTFNHTGMVSGIWANGDIEIRHQNWGGYSQTRFPRSEFRGFR